MLHRKFFGVTYGIRTHVTGITIPELRLLAERHTKELSWSGLQGSNLPLSAWKAKRTPSTARKMVRKVGLEPTEPRF